jgi:hypothetical protein
MAAVTVIRWHLAIRKIPADGEIFRQELMVISGVTRQI